ncbi:hypothetical protein [Bradyrhizobium embrapense]
MSKATIDRSAWLALSDEFGAPQRSPEEVTERKQISARCGHVTRRLRQGKRLTGKTLEFALQVVGEESAIGVKLKAGIALTDYESHLLIDVFLLHFRL